MALKNYGIEIRGLVYMGFESFRFIVFVNSIILLLIITLVLKKPFRKWGFAILLIFTIVFAAIEITAPLIREKNYEAFLVEIEKQLIEQYPTNNWTLNKDIDFYSFPYDFLVEVAFEDDSSVIYGFVLDEDGKLHEYYRKEQD